MHNFDSMGIAEGRPPRVGEGGPGRPAAWLRRMLQPAGKEEASSTAPNAHATTHASLPQRSGRDSMRQEQHAGLQEDYIQSDDDVLARYCHTARVWHKNSAMHIIVDMV